MANDPIKELMDRTRRIEIRLTRLMEALDVDSGVFRPLWDDGVIRLASPLASVKDCLAIIPTDWPKSKAVTVVLKEQNIATLTLT